MGDDPIGTMKAGIEEFLRGEILRSPLSQAEIARRSGVTRQQVQNLMKAHNSISLDTLAGLLVTLGFRVLFEPVQSEGKAGELAMVVRGLSANDVGLLLAQAETLRAYREAAPDTDEILNQEARTMRRLKATEGT